MCVAICTLLHVPSCSSRNYIYIYIYIYIYMKLVSLCSGHTSHTHTHTRLCVTASTNHHYFHETVKNNLMFIGLCIIVIVEE